MRHVTLTLVILMMCTALPQAQTAAHRDSAAGAVASGSTAGAPQLGSQVVPGGELAASVTAAAAAMQSDAGARDEQESVYDKIWQFAKWYENDSNPVVQEVLFSGRYQHEYNALTADQGDNGEWNVRRMRLGPKVTLFRNWLVHGEVELNPQEAAPLYVRITDLYVKWTQSQAFAVTVGKHGVAFTMDGSTSSKELLTIDRSNLSNNIWFPQEYIPGISVSGEVDQWVYHGGVYTGGTANPEFGEFDAGVFTLAAVGYDFGRNDRRQGSAADGQLRLRAGGSGQHIHAPAGARGLSQLQVRGRALGCPRRSVARHRVSRAERPVRPHGDAALQPDRQAAGGRALHAHHERPVQRCAPRDLRETRGPGSRRPLQRGLPGPQTTSSTATS